MSNETVLSESFKLLNYLNVEITVLIVAIGFSGRGIPLLKTSAFILVKIYFLK